MTIDNASDDEIYRTYARGEGEKEDYEINLAHRLKDEDLVRYEQQTKKLRMSIKYYRGNDGTMTLDQYVQVRQTELAKAKVADEALTKAADAELAQKKAEDDARKAKEKRHIDINLKYIELGKQLEAEYIPKIKAIKNERNVKDELDRLNRASAMEVEFVKKKEELAQREREEHQNVKNALN